MIKSSIEKISEDIGFDIGNSDDITQANLLNGFLRALSNMDENSLDMQVCYFVDKINPKYFRVINKINSFVEYRKENQ